MKLTRVNFSRCLIFAPRPCAMHLGAVSGIQVRRLTLPRLAAIMAGRERWMNAVVIHSKANMGVS